MEVAAPVVIVKMEPIKAVEAAETNANTNASNVIDKAKARKARRECAKACKAITAFGKTLRKSVQIPEKEAPEIVTDSDMSADKPVNAVESVKPAKTAEEINAETEAEMVADQKAFEEEFGNIKPDEFDEEFGSEFRLYPLNADKDDVIDADEAMIDDL
jgi:hypothetical protein